MLNLGNLVLFSITVYASSIALAETDVGLPSNGDTIDTDAENVSVVEEGEAQHQPFAAGNHKNGANNPDGEAEDGDGCNATTKVPLRFHPELKGRKVELSQDFRTATRTEPQESGGQASVVSQRSLCDEEVFQFRIDETIDWFDETLMENWGIGTGAIRDPGMEIKTSWGITYSINGTWAICSSPYTSSGTSDTFKDASPVTISGYPLDTRRLSVGTVLGISRHKNGDVHFYLNGVDKGIAFKDVPKEVYVFVEIMNYVSKISIVD